MRGRLLCKLGVFVGVFRLVKLAVTSALATSELTIVNPKPETHTLHGRYLQHYAAQLQR